MRMKNNKAGVSFIELMIATILIAIVAVVSIQFLVYCKRLMGRPKTTFQAANLARSYMEPLYNIDQSGVILQQAGNIADASLNNATFNTIVSGPTQNKNFNGYSTVTVTITWHDR